MSYRHGVDAAGSDRHPGMWNSPDFARLIAGSLKSWESIATPDFAKIVFGDTNPWELVASTNFASSYFARIPPSKILESANSVSSIFERVPSIAPFDSAALIGTFFANIQASSILTSTALTDGLFSDVSSWAFPTGAALRDLIGTYEPWTRDDDTLVFDGESDHRVPMAPVRRLTQRQADRLKFIAATFVTAEGFIVTNLALLLGDAASPAEIIWWSSALSFMFMLMVVDFYDRHGPSSE